jgi:hypothetical protein
LGERWEVIPVVLRVFDRDPTRTMERNFGFRHVRSTSALAAPWLVGTALGLDLLETSFVDQRTRVVTLRRASAAGVLEHPSGRGTRFQGGDQAYLLGPCDELLDVLRRDQRPRVD